MRKTPAKKVAIIDDDSVIVQGMLISFELAGFKTECMISGSNMKKMILESRPDMIFLDIKLANGLDGRIMTQELKNDPKFARIPIVLISANPNLKKEAAACKADDYLEKPFSVADIIKKARYHTRKKKAKTSALKLKAK